MPTPAGPTSSSSNAPVDLPERPLLEKPRRKQRARKRAGAGLPREWLRTARSLRCLGGISTGNQVQVYCDGDELFEALWRDIDSAARSVWLETYCLGSDRVGQRTVAALERARARGCEVILIYDSVGSMPIDDGLTAGLEAVGGRVICFNPVRPRSLPLLWMRDHRKITIIDHAVAYCGGMNISEEYAGLRHGTGRFHDCQLRLQGPCIADFAAIVRDSLQEAGVEPPAAEQRHVKRRKVSAAGRGEPGAAQAEGDGILVQVLGSNARRSVRSIQRALRCAIRRSRERCWITTPYFVPPLRTRRAMSHAAKRGVDVRLLTAGESDVPMARLAGRYVYSRLLRDGVRIYEMFGRTLHTKRATVDGVLGMVGSFNIDTWSDRRNLEVSATMLDPGLVAELEQHFLADLEQSQEVTLDGMNRQGWHRRAVEWAAYQLLRW